mmetsp:Transcript_15486/g.33593  ORF Transcript_15486/g.33593 Transcript_15486/m.33593 type:complete len:313 (-) Transcript_15486:378-1316(-)
MATLLRPGQTCRKRPRQEASSSSLTMSRVPAPTATAASAAGLPSSRGISLCACRYWNPFLWSLLKWSTATASFTLRCFSNTAERSRAKSDMGPVSNAVLSGTAAFPDVDASPACGPPALRRASAATYSAALSTLGPLLLLAGGGGSPADDAVLAAAASAAAFASAAATRGRRSRCSPPTRGVQMSRKKGNSRLGSGGRNALGLFSAAMACRMASSASRLMKCSGPSGPLLLGKAVLEMRALMFSNRLVRSSLLSQLTKMSCTKPGCLHRSSTPSSAASCCSRDATPLPSASLSSTRSRTTSIWPMDMVPMKV